MKLIEHAKIIESMGFKFNRVTYNHRVVFSYKNDRGYSITLTKSRTKKQLIIDANALITEYNEALTYRLERKKQNKIDYIRTKMRSSVVDGGMCWAPLGLSVGTPKGKLRLVA